MLLYSHTVDDTHSNKSHWAAVCVSILCEIKLGIILLVLNLDFGKDGKQQLRLHGISQNNILSKHTAQFSRLLKTFVCTHTQ